MGVILPFIQCGPVKRPSPRALPRNPAKKIRADKEAVLRAKNYLTTASSAINGSDACKKAFTIIGPAGKPPSSLQKVGHRVLINADFIANVCSDKRRQLRNY